MKIFDEPFYDHMMLYEARRTLMSKVRLGLAPRCPLCHRLVKVYKRPINAGMCHSLISMYRQAGTAWIHIPSMVGSRSREEGKLQHWGLIEQSLEKRDDGGAAGYWRVTRRGEQFLRGELSVQRRAHILLNELQGFSGPMVNISQALGYKFDLMDI